MYTFNSKVRFSEIGPDKSMTMGSIVNYLQDCSSFQSEELGVGIDELKQKARAWLLSSWQIQVDRYPVMGEEIKIGTYPYDFKGIYGFRNFFIKDVKGNYLVKANSIWFYVDTSTLHPVKPEPDAVAPYQMGPKLDMNYEGRKVILPEQTEKKDLILMQNHHMDTNNHVNNSQYVFMALDILPVEFKPMNMKVEYKHAAVGGDVIYPSIGKTEDGYCVILHDKSGSYYAAVRFS